MTDQRWHDLMKNDDLNLTQEEIVEGWHFCPDWDGLLIGPNMGEMDFCTCDPHPTSSQDCTEKRAGDGGLVL